VSIVAEPGDDPGLVVIAQVQRVPALRVETLLPPGKHPFEFGERPVADVPPSLAAIEIHVLEVKDHVERAGGDISSGVLDGRTDHLADGHRVVVRERPCFHLDEVLFQSRPVHEPFGTPGRNAFRTVR